jgi:DNA polymerase-3 subunit epsilon
MNKLAVIDTETTGFGRTDRILEIGIVLIDDGKIVDEWETILNPLRDVSNSNIHGITPDSFALAPTFSELNNDISRILNNRILVAHNLSFDQNMLNMEYKRISKEVIWGQGICTLKISKLKLEQACAKFNIRNSLAHSALSDAKATAELVNYLDLQFEDFSPSRFPVDSKLPLGRRLHRQDSDFQPNIKLKSSRRFTENADISVYEGDLLTYVDVLSKAISDLTITKSELKQLSEVYLDLGLKKEDINRINNAFINSILEASLRDGSINNEEEKILKELSEALKVDIVLPKTVSISKELLILKPGTRVCFTGTYLDEKQNLISKEDLGKIATKFGMVAVDAVTKKECDLLVASDAKSMSGKSKKARNFGIPIISTQEFLKLTQNG